MYSLLRYGSSICVRGRDVWLKRIGELHGTSILDRWAVADAYVNPEGLKREIWGCDSAPGTYTRILNPATGKTLKKVFRVLTTRR